MSTGLKIVATVCDQGATNVAVINKLKDETNRYCMHQNVENRYFGFLIEDVEIVSIFDPPHLLKCIRNNLMTNILSHIAAKIVQRHGAISRLYMSLIKK